MSGQPMFSEREQEEIARRYTAGERSPTLAVEYGCTTATIRKYVKMHGGVMRKPGGSPLQASTDQMVEVMRLYVSGGLSVETISGRTGLHQETVRKILKKRGVSPERRYATAGRHGHWKGGRRVDNTAGYVWIKISPDDPLAIMRNSGGYVQEHRYVVATQVGRPLEPHETVHHVDGDKTNNDPSNLQLRHGRHGNGIVYKCRCCGSTDIQAIEL